LTIALPSSEPAVQLQTRFSAAQCVRSRTGDQRCDPWVLIAEGFHSLGGMDKANAALASYLVSQRIPVHLVAFSVAPELLGKPGVKCTTARLIRGSASLGRLHLARLGRVVAKRVTSQSPAARVLVNGINCKWPDINWVHWLHHRWRSSPFNAPLWFRFKHRLETYRAVLLERTALASAKLLLANSNRTARDLVKLVGVAPERVRTIYLGTDSGWNELTPRRRDAARAWLEVAPGRPLVAFIGALGHDLRKGFDILWRAWSDLCRSSEWDADLVVAGSGRALAHWRREAYRSGLDGRVRFIGFTDRVLDVLAASDLLVSPARYDSYGLNVQEALCCGVPAIVSANAGVAEQYPPELSGLLLPNPEDRDDLGNRMLQWRRDMAGWMQRIQPTMRILRRYTWDDMARRIVELVEDGG
jgi:glycosyltransferase involved in cell wall biosynthesis